MLVLLAYSVECFEFFVSSDGNVAAKILTAFLRGCCGGTNCCTVCLLFGRLIICEGSSSWSILTGIDYFSVYTGVGWGVMGYIVKLRLWVGW